MLKNKEITEIFRRWQENEPEPKTELVYPNEYCLLVCIILSAQATDVSVNKATAPLFKIADNPKDMLQLGEETLKNYVNTIGLFNTKAKNVILMSQRLIDVYDSKIPETRDELQTLAGVGRKTANVWLNCARGEHTIAIDTHVFRVANRIGFTKVKNVQQSEKMLEKIIPDLYKQYAHHWLILHGRYTCKARKPECYKCCVSDLCPYDDKSTQ